MRPSPTTETEAWCGACRQMHPRSDFGKDRNKVNGLASACKAVVSERNRTSHAARRAHNNDRHRSLRAIRKASPDAVSWVMKRLLRDARRRAVAKNIPFSLTVRDLFTLVTCPLLGIALVYQATEKRVAGSASIDRIDSTLGYTPDNCWVISWRANQIKSDATLEELQRITESLAVKIGKKAAGRLLDGREWSQFPEVRA